MLCAVNIFFEHGNSVFTCKCEMSGVEKQEDEILISHFHQPVNLISGLNAGSHVMVNREIHILFTCQTSHLVEAFCYNFPFFVGFDILKLDILCIFSSDKPVNINLVLIHTLVYDWHDYPMDTLDQLQDLVDELSASLPPSAVLNIPLPAVTYPGELVIRSRAVNLLGSGLLMETPWEPVGNLAAVAVARKRQAPGIILFHQGPISKEAMTLAEACEDIKVTFLSLWDILTPQDRADLAPGDKEIDEAILARLALGKKKRKDALSRPFSQGRTGRYLLCAAGLFAASFFVAYPIYYRLMAALCITFGAMAYVVGQAESTAAS